jgi:hypothetical protein
LLVQSERVDEGKRVVGDVAVEVDVAAREADRILADKPLQAGVVVARPVVVEVQRFIVLPAREPIRGRRRRPHRAPNGS